MEGDGAGGLRAPTAATGVPRPGLRHGPGVLSGHANLEKQLGNTASNARTTAKWTQSSFYDVSISKTARHATYQLQLVC